MSVPSSPQDSPDVAAIVVTYNRCELLKQCLERLLNQHSPLSRIYVMDNASTDGTPQVIPDDPRVTYVRLERNLGGAYGFSRGVELALEARHDWLWLLDDDGLPEPDALAQLLAHAGHDGPDEVLCSAVLARDGRPDLQQRRAFDARRLREQPLPLQAYAHPSVPVDLFTFVAVLLPVQAVRRAGLPLDNYFFMYDDFEYALRLRRLGVGARLVPGSRVWHHGSLPVPSPRPPYNPLKHYYNTRNQLLVYRRYGTSRPWFAVRFLVKTAGAYIRLVQHRELSVRSARLAAAALSDGLRGRAYVRSFGR